MDTPKIPERPRDLAAKMDSIEAQCAAIERGDALPLPSAMKENPRLAVAFLTSLDTITSEECRQLGREMRIAGHGNILAEIIDSADDAGAIYEGNANAILIRAIDSLHWGANFLTINLFSPSLTSAKYMALLLLAIGLGQGSFGTAMKNSVMKSRRKLRTFRKEFLNGPVR